MREAAPGKGWQEARGANSRGGRAAARVRAGTWGCGREAGRVGEGCGQERGGAAAAAAAAAAAKRPCCVVCGAGGGGGGSKAERGDGRETPHTHGTRWPERQQHPELSGAPPRPRGPPAGGNLRAGDPQARGAKRPRLRRGGPRAGVGARGRGARGARAHDAESAAAAAAAEAPRGPGSSTRRGREARAGGTARNAGAGDLEVPTAALGPGEWLPGSFYCPLSLGGKAKCP